MSLEDFARYIDAIAPPATGEAYVERPGDGRKANPAFEQRRRRVLVGAAAAFAILVLAVGLVLIRGRSDDDSANVFAGPGAGEPADGVAGTDATVAVLCPVVFAYNTIPAGTSAREATANGMVRESSIPVQFIPTTAVRDLKHLSGSATFDIAPNTVIVEAMFTPENPSTSPSPSPPPECQPTGSLGTDQPGPIVVPDDSTSLDPGVPADNADAGATTPLLGNPAAAQVLGERLVAEVPWGECIPADQLDLGILAGTADWVEVCGVGLNEPGQRGVRVNSDELVPNLYFGPERLPMPSICMRRVVGDWWSYYSGQGLAEPCSASFEFQGL